MNLQKMADATSMRLLNNVSLDKDIQDVYIGDLLSFVMANGQSDTLWLTVQRHINVIAVAELNDFSGVVFVQGVEPDEDTLLKATQLNIPLLTSDLSAFELTKQLINQGL